MTTVVDADESRAQVEATKVVSVANATGGGVTNYSVKSRYTLTFEFE
jgi:DNA-binding transcriptional regulator YdaS (Cro superfamily)